MSSKPFFKKSLKSLLKLLIKKLLRRQGGTYSKLEILILISKASPGFLNKSRKMGGSPSFCSTLPGFFVPESKKGILFS